jgi:hypothetical protein
MTIEKFLKIVGLGLFVLLSFYLLWRDFNLLFQTSLAVGIDGYYYVLQVDSVSHQGHFYFPNYTPIVLLFLTAIKFLVQDAVLALKFGAIVLHLLLSLGVFTFIKTLTKNFGWGLGGVVCLNLSNLHFYFLSEFLSNLGALVGLVWGLVFLLKWLENKQRKYFLFLALSILLAIFSHRSALPLMVLIGMCSVLGYFLPDEKFSSAKKIVLCFFAFLILISPLILAWQPFFDLPNSLNSEFLKIPRLPFNQAVLPESLALLLTLGITVFLYFRRSDVFKNKLMSRSLLAICWFSLLLTLNPFVYHQTGFLGIFGRLMSLSSLQLAVAIPLVLFILQRFSTKSAIILGLIFLPFIIWSFLSPLPMALWAANIQKREGLVKGLAEIKPSLCENSFIIAPHGEQFVVTALTGIPSQQTPPLDSNNSCLYWLIHQPKSEKKIDFSDSIKTDDFVLVEDKFLPQTLEKLTAQDLRELFINNPHLRKSFSRKTLPR